MNRYVFRHERAEDEEYDIVVLAENEPDARETALCRAGLSGFLVLEEVTPS